MSRWRMPWAWAYSSASATCKPIWATLFQYPAWRGRLLAELSRPPRIRDDAEDESNPPVPPDALLSDSPPCEALPRMEGGAAENACPTSMVGSTGSER